MEIRNKPVLLLLVAVSTASACNKSNHRDPHREVDENEVAPSVETREAAEWDTPGVTVPNSSVCDPGWNMTFADWSHISDAVVVGTVARVEPVLDTLIVDQKGSIDECDPETTQLAIDITLQSVEVLTGDDPGDSVTIRVGNVSIDHWDSTPGVRIGSTFYSRPRHDVQPLASIPDGGIGWSQPNVGFVPGHRIGVTLFESDTLQGNYWTLDFPVMTVTSGDVAVQHIARLDNPCETLPVAQTTLDDLQAGFDDAGDPSDRAERRRTDFAERGTGDAGLRGTLTRCKRPGDDGTIDPADAGPDM